MRFSPTRPSSEEELRKPKPRSSDITIATGWKTVSFRVGRGGVPKSHTTITRISSFSPSSFEMRVPENIGLWVSVSLSS